MRGSWTDLSKQNRNIGLSSSARCERRIIRPKLVSISSHRHDSTSLPSLLDLERGLAEGQDVLECQYFAKPANIKHVKKNRSQEGYLNSPILSAGSDSSVCSAGMDTPPGRMPIFPKSRTTLLGRSRDSMTLQALQSEKVRNCLPVKLQALQSLHSKLHTPIISVTDENDTATVLSSPSFSEPPSPYNWSAKPAKNGSSHSLEVPATEYPSPDLSSRTKLPAQLTQEMLDQHSYHYYLMNNFFLSDSDSDSPTPARSKKVRFAAEMRFLSPSPELKSMKPSCSCQQNNSVRFVYIQVAGTMFQTQWTTLERHPNTLLGSSEKYDYYDHSR